MPPIEEPRPSWSTPLRIRTEPVKVLLPFKVTVLVFSCTNEPRPVIELLTAKLLVELKTSQEPALTSVTLPEPSALVVTLRTLMLPRMLALVQLPVYAELLPVRISELVVLPMFTVRLPLP